MAVDNMVFKRCDMKAHDPQGDAKYQHFLKNCVPRKCDCGNELTPFDAYHSEQCIECYYEANRLESRELCVDCGGVYSADIRCSCGKRLSVKNYRVFVTKD